MVAYAPEVADQIKRFYDSLSEKDRRRYAAVEAAKLGYGGALPVGVQILCAAGRPGSRSVKKG